MERTTESRTNNFTVGVVSTTTFKTITVKISVTVPDKNGNFSIITQIGDETPVIRETNLNNEKIVKTR